MPIVCLALNLYTWAVVAWVILSWIRVSSEHPLGRVQVALDKIIYPVILPLRRVMPPVRLGGAMLDLSPIVLIIGLQLITRFVC